MLSFYLKTTNNDYLMVLLGGLVLMFFLSSFLLLVILLGSLFGFFIIRTLLGSRNLVVFLDSGSLLLSVMLVTSLFNAFRELQSKSQFHILNYNFSLLYLDADGFLGSQLAAVKVGFKLLVPFLEMVFGKTELFSDGLTGITLRNYIPVFSLC